eukprot:292833-Lingulodinium_polyedra.AAC.1
MGGAGTQAERGRRGGGRHASRCRVAGRAAVAQPRGGHPWAGRARAVAAQGGQDQGRAPGGRRAAAAGQVGGPGLALARHPPGRDRDCRSRAACGDC